MILHDFTALLTSLQVGFAAFEALKKEGVQVHRRPVSWRLRQHLAKSWCIVVSRVVELGWSKFQMYQNVPESLVTELKGT